jgi:lysophospholipase L1-like esterase
MRSAGREWLLLAASVGASTLLALLLLRWLAPSLFGVAPDLRVVQVAEEVPPFYENVFRQGDLNSDELLVQDPYTVVRTQPLRPPGPTGPTDVLGFRNAAVPNRADVVAIGDSQTFGLNAPLQGNWPSRLDDALGDRSSVYAMAGGGWGAVQYLDIFRKALFLDPRLVIVAFYSGNDAMESFRVAYSVEHWSDLRVDPDIPPDQRPPAPPAPADDIWEARFGPGETDFMVFTPGRRLYANRQHPVVDAGWKIMAEVGRRIAAEARAAGVAVVFAIIPTKELIYAERVAASGLTPPDDYARLVELERPRIEALAESLRGLGGVTTVDLLGPLSRAALQQHTHLRGPDGHPRPRGYTLIAETLAPTAAAQLAQISRDSAVQPLDR